MLFIKRRGAPKKEIDGLQYEITPLNQYLANTSKTTALQNAYTILYSYIPQYNNNSQILNNVYSVNNISSLYGSGSNWNSVGDANIDWCIVEACFYGDEIDTENVTVTGGVTPIGGNNPYFYLKIIDPTTNKERKIRVYRNNNPVGYNVGDAAIGIDGYNRDIIPNYSQKWGYGGDYEQAYEYYCHEGYEDCYTLYDGYIMTLFLLFYKEPETDYPYNEYTQIKAFWAVETDDAEEYQFHEECHGLVPYTGGKMIWNDYDWDWESDPPVYANPPTQDVNHIIYGNWSIYDGQGFEPIYDSSTDTLTKVPSSCSTTRLYSVRTFGGKGEVPSDDALKTLFAQHFEVDKYYYLDDAKALYDSLHAT